MLRCPLPNHDHERPLIANVRCTHMICWQAQDELLLGVYVCSAPSASTAKLLVLCSRCTHVLLYHADVTSADDDAAPISPLDGWLWRSAAAVPLCRALEHRAACTAPRLADACSGCAQQSVDTALGCGHCYCAACALRLHTCPECRRPIARRSALYL